MEYSDDSKSGFQSPIHADLETFFVIMGGDAEISSLAGAMSDTDFVRSLKRLVDDDSNIASSFADLLQGALYNAKSRDLASGIDLSNVEQLFDATDYTERMVSLLSAVQEATGINLFYEVVSRARANTNMQENVLKMWGVKPEKEAEEKLVPEVPADLVSLFKSVASASPVSDMKSMLALAQTVSTTYAVMRNLEDVQKTTMDLSPHGLVNTAFPQEQKTVNEPANEGPKAHPRLDLLYRDFKEYAYGDRGQVQVLTGAQADAARQMIQALSDALRLDGIILAEDDQLNPEKFAGARLVVGERFLKNAAEHVMAMPYAAADCDIPRPEGFAEQYSLLVKAAVGIARVEPEVDPISRYKFVDDFYKVVLSEREPSGGLVECKKQTTRGGAPCAGPEYELLQAADKFFDAISAVKPEFFRRPDDITRAENIPDVFFVSEFFAHKMRKLIIDNKLSPDWKEIAEPVSDLLDAMRKYEAEKHLEFIEKGKPDVASHFARFDETQMIVSSVDIRTPQEALHPVRDKDINYDNLSATNPVKIVKDPDKPVVIYFEGFARGSGISPQEAGANMKSDMAEQLTCLRRMLAGAKQIEQVDLVGVSVNASYYSVLADIYRLKENDRFFSEKAEVITKIIFNDMVTPMPETTDVVERRAAMDKTLEELDRLRFVGFSYGTVMYKMMLNYLEDEMLPKMGFKPKEVDEVLSHIVGNMYATLYELDKDNGKTRTAHSVSVDGVVDVRTNNMDSDFFSAVPKHPKYQELVDEHGVNFRHFGKSVAFTGNFIRDNLYYLVLDENDSSIDSRKRGAGRSGAEAEMPKHHFHAQISSSGLKLMPHDKPVKKGRREDEGWRAAVTEAVPIPEKKNSELVVPMMLMVPDLMAKHLRSSMRLGPEQLTEMFSQEGELYNLMGHAIRRSEYHTDLIKLFTEARELEAELASGKALGKHTGAEQARESFRDGFLDH